jgi:Mg-chelatase subunit ChlD
VNTSSNISAIVYDSYYNPVENINITFSVTPPEDTFYNSPNTYNSASLAYYSGTTDSSGIVPNVFTTDKKAGGNVISINVLDTSLQHNVTITGIADEIDNFFLSYTPDSSLSNNEDYYTLSARPVDQFLNPIFPLSTPIKEQVKFTTDSGSTVLVPLNSHGSADTVVGPTPYIESLSVTATYKNESGFTNFTNSSTLYFTAGPLDSMDFYANPSTVLSQDLSGNHESDLVLVALDEWGHSLPNIHVLINNTNRTVGTFSIDGYNDTDLINATTDSDGRINGLFTGNISGNATILANSGNLSLSTNVSVKAEPFLSVKLNVTPFSVSSGSIVNITTEISVEGELPITRPAASAMLVLDRSGSMDPDYYAGTPLDVALAIDRSGSMGPEHGNGMPPAKEAAKEFASNLVSNSQIGVVSFGSESRVDLELTLLNSSANLLLVNKSIDKLGAVAGTALGEGMADANNMLISEGRSDSRKIMILLTDGEASSGTEDPDGSEAIELANANGITIYTIGLGSANEAILRTIASDTGGKYYFAPSSSNLTSIYNSIAQDICDYDITDIEYGEEGFTPYSYTFSDSISIEDTYTLSFDGYDFDDVFDASPYYGGTSAGECLIKVNGNILDLLPSVQNPSNSDQPKPFNYDITDYVHSGENSLSLYDYYDYTGYKDYYDYYGYSYWPDIGDNWVSNVVVKHNGNTIKSYSTSTLLDGSGYVLSFDAPLSTDYFEDTFEINESLDDLKVELQWDHEYANLDLQLVSPSGRVYGIGNDTTGYYPGSDGKSEYLWVHPLPDLYETDEDTIETGTWTVRVTGINNGGTGTWLEPFTISTYIDKKSATQLSSHAFMSSFDETRGDSAGLALYSYEDVVSSDTQTSYVLANSTWVGYFTPDTDSYYVFNVSWDDSSTVNVSLYDGIDVLSSSAGSSYCEVSSLLSAGETYNIDVSKGAGVQADTEFTVDVSTTGIDTVMTAYYDSGGGGGTPKVRTWDGSDWSTEDSANYIGANLAYMILESSPTNSDVIMMTSGTDNAVSAQRWDGSSWNNVNQFTDGLSSYGTRGFDIKYEQISGDSVAVYGDGYRSWDWWDWEWKYTGYSAPSYRVWDGSWSSESTVDGSNFGSGNIAWVRLEAKPNSDEMTLITLDDEEDMRAQIWDGSFWSDQITLTNNAVTSSYQCFDVMYETNSGRSIVVWADDDGYVKYRVWNGNSWDPTTYNMYSYSKDVYWIKMAADPNSDRILLAAEDKSYDIYVTDWDGSSWETPLRVEKNVYEYSRRSVDVAFEQESGKGIIVWGDSSTTPKYGTWNGNTWDLEYSASTIGSTGYTRWVQLTPNPSSDDIFLMTSDGSNGLNIQNWDGSSWDTVTEVEPSSTRNYECFDIVFSATDQEPVTTPVSWNEWTGSVTSTFDNDSLSHLENAIDTITADGLTAIDEGLYLANNELSSADGNSTIVIMTDGLDNAGYHSLLEEAYRAKDNDTVIYTVGFGNSESEVDPILEEIATITGGEYYFAPNSSVLKEIFQGIAMQITNFSAGGPVLDIDVPYNYITPLTVAKATYQSGSSNSTTGNETFFIAPTAPSTGNAEPTITTSNSTSTLEWQLPNMGAGDKWGIWYQMKVNGAGYVPIIMPTSTITYTDLSGQIIEIQVSGGGSTSLSGSIAEIFDSEMQTLILDIDKDTIAIENSTSIYLDVINVNGSSSYSNVYLYSNIGYFTDNYNSVNNGNPINVTVIGDSDYVDFTSSIAGKVYITAYAYNQGNSNDTAVLVNSTTLYVKPKGKISIS